MSICHQALINIRYRAYHDCIARRLKSEPLYWLQIIDQLGKLMGKGKWESIWAEAAMENDLGGFLRWMSQNSQDGHQRRLKSPLLGEVSERDKWLVLKATAPTRLKGRSMGSSLADFEFAVFASLDAEFDGRRAPELDFIIRDTFN